MIFTNKKLGEEHKKVPLAKSTFVLFITKKFFFSFIIGLQSKFVGGSKTNFLLWKQKQKSCTSRVWRPVNTIVSGLQVKSFLIK